MSDRIENLGLLTEKKQHEQLLRLKLSALREQIYRGANPYRPLAGFRGDDAVVITQELARGLDEWRRLCGDITRLCRELNEPVPSFD